MNQVPLRLELTIHQHYGVIIDAYGVPCKLFIPQNIDERESLDIYSERPKRIWKAVDTKVFIEWAPDSKRLRKLGIHIENEIPVIGWLKDTGLGVEKGSYLKLTQYIGGQWQPDRLEIVDVLVKYRYMTDTIIAYRLAPLRVEISEYEEESTGLEL